MEKSIELIGNQSLNTPFFWVLGVILFFVLFIFSFFLTVSFLRYVYSVILEIRQEMKDNKLKAPIDYRDTKDYKAMVRLYSLKKF